MAFINFKTCCSDSKQLIRLAVLVICLCVSCYQLSQSIRKLQFPPISTHYGFYLNKSLKYPAITICRNPPYKTDRFEKFGFTGNKEIQIASTWKSFNFKNHTVREFFENTTYTFNEMIKIAALNRHMKDIEITSSFALSFGRCYTLTPKTESTDWGSNHGYFLMFSQINVYNQFERFIGVLSGFHVFIQHEVEKFTEKTQEADIFQEYIYVESGDNVQVNIKMNKYNQLPSRTNDCNPQGNYSKSRCIEDTVNQLISEQIGCSVPWIPNENLPLCSTYEEIEAIVERSTPSIYLDKYLDQTNCPLRCNATTYTPFLQSIRQVPAPQCNLKIYFSSNLYTQMEEVAGYDWNAFLSDLGGSLGFLLGLSVLGMIGLAEEFIDVIFRLKQKRQKKVGDKVVKKEEAEGAKSENAIGEYQMRLKFQPQACPNAKF